MQPDMEDAAYLWDMRETARAVLKFVGTCSLDHYGADRMLRGALERHLFEFRIHDSFPTILSRHLPLVTLLMYLRRESIALLQNRRARRLRIGDDPCVTRRR
jgi:hypothetical protein